MLHRHSVPCAHFFGGELATRELVISSWRRRDRVKPPCLQANPLRAALERGELQEQIGACALLGRTRRNAYYGLHPAGHSYRDSCIFHGKRGARRPSTSRRHLQHLFLRRSRRRHEDQSCHSDNDLCRRRRQDADVTGFGSVGMRLASYLLAGASQTEWHVVDWTLGRVDSNDQSRPEGERRLSAVGLPERTLRPRCLIRHSTLADIAAKSAFDRMVVIGARSASVGCRYNAISRSRFAMARGVANDRRSRIALASGSSGLSVRLERRIRSR